MRVSGWRRPVFRVLLKVDSPRTRTWALRLSPGFRERMKTVQEEHGPYTLEEIRQRLSSPDEPDWPALIEFESGRRLSPKKL